MFKYLYSNIHTYYKREFTRKAYPAEAWWSNNGHLHIRKVKNSAAPQSMKLDTSAVPTQHYKVPGESPAFGTCWKGHWSPMAAVAIDTFINQQEVNAGKQEEVLLFPQTSLYLEQAGRFHHSGEGSPQLILLGGTLTNLSRFCQVTINHLR